MMSSTIRLWLGGSFDPVHLGHLAMIEHVYQTLAKIFPATSIIAKLLPTAGSPLKDNPTANIHRLNMLNLAIQDYPFLSVDTFELYQTPPVYTFNTFSEFRQLYPNDCLIFIMGADSVLQLERWYRGNELTRFTNLWVISRPAFHHVTDTSSIVPITHSPDEHLMLSNQLNDYLKKLLVDSPKDLINQTTNHIYIDSYHPLDIASRQIRLWLSDQKNTTALTSCYLPSKVYDYIVSHQLYCR